MGTICLPGRLAKLLRVILDVGGQDIYTDAEERKAQVARMQNAISQLQAGLSQAVGLDPPLGLRVVGLRAISDDELKMEGWELDINGAPPALVFDDGTVVYPSQDPEGNGPGAMFGRTPKGESFIMCTPNEPLVVPEVT